MKTNPKHITPQPLPGQRLPDDWRNATSGYGGNYDRRNFSEMWKQEPTHKQIQIDSPTRNARLTPFPSEQLFGKK